MRARGECKKISPRHACEQRIRCLNVLLIPRCVVPGIPRTPIRTHGLLTIDTYQSSLNFAGRIAMPGFFARCTEYSDGGKFWPDTEEQKTMFDKKKETYIKRFLEEEYFKIDQNDGTVINLDTPFSDPSNNQRTRLRIRCNNVREISGQLRRYAPPS